jgi:hypothetical protein
MKICKLEVKECLRKSVKSIFQCSEFNNKLHLIKGGFMKNSLFTIFFLFANLNVQAATPTLSYVQSISPQLFLKLPDEVQALYVGAILDGMTFTSYGYQLPEHDKFVKCTQTMTLGALGQKVSSWLKANPTNKEGVATAVAHVMGASCNAK